MTATPRPVAKGDHVFLVDGSSYIFRAYHALPPLTRKSDGLPIGAVSGFCNMLWRLMRETVAGERPTHLAVIFDHSAQTFRNDLYDQYKATRSEPPDDLIPQFGLIRQATRAFDIGCIEQEGFEADDLIATYARLATEAGATTTIVASDKDLMQLVSDRVTMYDTMKEKRIGRAEVFEKFGVEPEKVVEVQALAGDSIDNVPGVPGIGIKTAAQLVTEYGDLESLLARAGEIKQPKRREALIEHAEKARISLKLVTLECSVPLATPIDDLALHQPDPRNLVAFLKAMELTTLTRRVAEAYGVETSEVEADPRLVGEGARMAKQGFEGHTPLYVAPAPPEGAPEEPRAAPRPHDPRRAHDPKLRVGAMAPADLAAMRGDALRALPWETAAYECVGTLARLREWIARAEAAGTVAIDTETTHIDSMQAELIGIALCLAPGEACYIPLGHKEGKDDLFGNATRLDGQVDPVAALEALRLLLENRSVLKIGHNLKYDWVMFARQGIDVSPCEDTMLLSYVLEAGTGGHGLNELSERHLGHKPIAFGEVVGTGRNATNFDKAPLDRATAYAAEDADVTLRLWRALKPRLAAESMAAVYETLERPLIPVLARMERRGISIDRNILSRLSGQFAQSMGRLEAEIRDVAGESINLGSPKQIGDILFGKMGLPGGKKTPTGAWATGARALEELAEQGHPLPKLILDWRQISKLRSTYTDLLPGYVNATTGRVHTSYALAATTTGRLSSSEPNLQNIPVRTQAGREIRTAFIATEGHKLVSADYSQIELRILAHIADIPQLTKAFSDGVDIHAMTASEMFSVPLEQMTPDVRRRAKAINFGIIYGISAFGLANQLAIPREEASAYIKQYFERFPGIRAYMDRMRKEARAQGFVRTLFGRKCHYPQITASNPSERAFNERAAINAPIQGTAADIIRRAMARMDTALSKEKLSARMLLQVHDELVFEVPDDEVEATLPVITRVMEDAPHPALQLAVPLKVDARAAQNWDEAH